MLIVVLHILASLAGLCVGYWLRGFESARSAPATPPSEELSNKSAEKPAEDAASADSPPRHQEVMDRLRRLAESMAADVDEHTTQVREISDELNSSEHIAGEAVVEAVGRIIAANEEMQGRLDAAEQKLQRQARKLELQTLAARTDPLTTVSNRRVFDEEIALLEERFRNEQRPFSLLLLDVDHFREFNNTHGHLAGDDVLRGVARVLRRNLSESETVARYGGEEFAVLFPHCSAEEAQLAARRVQAAVAEAQYRHGNQQFHATVSAGLAASQTGDDAEAVIEHADRALYAAKEAGRNCGFVYAADSLERFTPDAEATEESSPETASV